ncbi:M28 family peptidase [Solicola sp. PLA-1-18]|uniref:M28 family peptidase n=1 Tax=Solicola sp. PLA-1-18 TaxID=3380532 RepID=UPI003B7BC726
MRARRTPVAMVAAAFLGLGLVAPTTAATAAAEDDTLKATEKIRKAVSAKSLTAHLTQLDAAAKRYGDRAAGTEGYDAAGRYVEFKLREAGYKPTRQYFDFEFEEVQKQEVTVGGAAVEAIPATYSPSTPTGGVSSTLAVPTTPLGCDAAAYAGSDVAGKIVVVNRGECPFGQKATVAKAAGAAAVLIANNEAGPLNATLGDPAGDYAPALGITQAEGQRLAGLVGTAATVDLQVLRETRRTFNVIAETKGGDEDNVVMLGAHLDGVEDTVAANDNGTGAAAVLETALQLPKQKGLKNKVRFAFWGAEELGLIGSTEYVNDLVETDPAALDDIATYLNFDMLGSPNWVTSVYDADQSTYESTVPIPAGSIETENAFRSYFKATKQPVVDTEFSGRSDYQAFIENGVAAGGVFSGADGTKTEAEQQLFGGTAGLTYDPNYHTAKDDLANVNTKALHVHGDAVAHLTLTLARSTRIIDVPNPEARTFSAKKKVAYGLPDGVERR